jgi:hypothetical protein
MVLGSGIRDPESGKNLFRIPYPGIKKHPIPDPDPQHWFFTFEPRRLGYQFYLLSVCFNFDKF